MHRTGKVVCRSAIGCQDMSPDGNLAARLYLWNGSTLSCDIYSCKFVDLYLIIGI